MGAHFDQRLGVAGQVAVEPAADGAGVLAVGGDAFAAFIQPLRTHHQRFHALGGQPAGQTETGKARFVTEDHALGGFALFERPLKGFLRIEDLGGLEVLITHLPADFIVLFVDVRGQFDELYFGGVVCIFLGFGIHRLDACS